MRRSLGQKPQTSSTLLPPKRVRQSQENAGPAPTSSRQSRSMAPTSGMSSGKRVSSVSRLPVAATSTGQKRTSRSSSNGPAPLNERNKNLVTPSSSRVKSSFMTPQRVSVAPQSRMSMSGTASKRMSGRGSHMGARVIKDTRPLTDKAYQTEQIRKILDFLRANGYHNTSLTSKHFPLNSKEFVAVFNFLYSFLDPRISAKLPTVKFEEEALKVLKSLHYPGNLTKSNFVAMGSLHSWPTVLGSISYLCDLAKIYSEKLKPMDNFYAIAFPAVDDDGLPINKTNKHKLNLDFFLECFHKFNEGEEDVDSIDFTDQRVKLRQDLLENNDIDGNYLKNLDQQVQQKKAELDELAGKQSNLTGLLEKRKAHGDDMKKMEEYLANLNHHVEERKLELGKYPAKKEALKEKASQLQTEIGELKSKCSNPCINIMEAEKNSFMINEKRRNIDGVKNDIEEIEKGIWDLEMKSSKVNDVIDSTIRQINAKAIEAGLKTNEGEVFKLADFRLSDISCYGEIKSNLLEAVKQAKADHRNVEKEVATGEALLEENKDKLADIVKLVANKKLEKVTLVNEIKDLKEKFAQEEKLLDEKLMSVKSQLLEIKSKDKMEIGKIEAELLEAKRRLEDMKKKRITERERGEEFLRKVLDKTISYFEQCNTIEKTASDSLVALMKRRVEEVKTATKDIEDKCKDVV